MANADTSFSSRAEHEVWIDRRAVPPAFVITQFENRKMQVRRVRRSVSGRADVTNHITLGDELTIVKSVRIVIEVRVVVAKLLRRIELVDGVAACFADKQFRDLAVLDRSHRRIAGRQQVDRLMSMRLAPLRDSAKLPSIAATLASSKGSRSACRRNSAIAS